MFPAKVEAGEDHAQQATMERQAALPDLENLQGVTPDLWLVEQAVTNPATENDPKDQGEDQVPNFLLRDG